MQRNTVGGLGPGDFPPAYFYATQNNLESTPFLSAISSVHF